MRKFKLINEKGQEFSLMRRDAFFSSPSGLGFTLNTTLTTVGRYFVVTDREFQNTKISGEMEFAGYAQYNEFTEFLTEKIKLGYAPLGEWFFVDGSVTGITKTEIDSDTGRLFCSIEITPTSQWYKESKFIQSEPGEEGGKKYSYAYPYTYVGGEPGIISINNGGADGSPCRIYIMGPCVNPHWELIQNGASVAQGRVNATIPQGRKLLVSSLASDMQISELSGDNAFVQDLYTESDFSTTRFIYLPSGQSALTVSDSSGSEISAYVEVIEIAATV